MSNSNKKKVLLVVTLLISSGFVLCIAGKMRHILCDKTVCLMPKYDNQTFSESDLSVLENENMFFSFAFEVYPEVSNGVCAMDIPVIATNENYVYFSNAEIKKGAFFNDLQINNGLKVAVVNDKTAYQMFGNCDCVGEYIYLNQIPLKIVGVVTESSREETKIYISESLLADLGIADANPQQIWCQSGNAADLLLGLSKMDSSIKDFHVTELDLCKKVFFQRFWMILMAGLLLVLWKMQDRRCLVVCSLRLLGTGFLIMMMRISWCVPSNYKLLDDKGNILFGEMLNFYTMADVKLSSVPTFMIWNILSIIFMLISLFVVCIMLCLKNK